MCGPAHTIHAARAHYGWDRSIAPVLTVAPGETVAFECRDAADGQLGSSSTAADLARLDPERVNPVTGPVRVDGAEPGDALIVRIGSFRPSGRGWTANIPGFGLLADRFPDPALHLWSYDPTGSTPLLYGDHARIALAPFCGTMGVAPAAAGRHSVLPPRRVGGNLDMRDLTAGATLILPVEVEGALFSVGDTHAAQGDGEVCGTAVESAMTVELTFDVVRGAGPEMPRMELPAAASSTRGADGWDVTTGVGPDLMEGARAAVSQMVELLAAREGMTPEAAYMLASVAGDLRLAEVVDAPNWVVAFHMPRAIFR